MRQKCKIPSKTDYDRSSFQPKYFIKYHPKKSVKIAKHVKYRNEKIFVIFIKNRFYPKISYNIKVSTKIPEIYLMKFLSFFGENFW